MIKLRKILRDEAVISLLKNLAGRDNCCFGIFDVEGRLLWGENPTVFDTLPKREIEIKDQVIGYVKGEMDIDVVPLILNLIIRYEQEKRNILNETLERYKEINLLYNLGEKLNSNFNIHSIAKLIVQEVLDNLRGDAASLLLYDKNSDKLEVIAYKSLKGFAMDAFRLKPGEGIGGHVFQIGQPEIVNEVSQDERFKKSDEPIASIMSVPLKVEEKAIGVVNLSSSESYQYSSTELKLLYAIASQAAFALENSQLHKQKVKEDRIKNKLQRYVSSNLVEAIIHSENEHTFEPEKKNITILFTDIRNFTQKCEALPPELIVHYLNQYFSHMVGVIFKHQGTINKFVGDMIVALFGAPYDLLEDAKHAVRAAVNIQKLLHTIDDEWIRNNFLTGIGICKGEVIVGNIGSDHHTDYTAIGDAVNVASRLQGLAKGGQILVEESIYEETKNMFTYRKFEQAILLKGRQKAVHVFEVLY